MHAFLIFTERALALLCAFVERHGMAFSSLGAALALALIGCLPEQRPRSADDWYRYVREALQTAIPSRRHNP